MGKKNRNKGKELSQPSPKIVKKKGKWRLGLFAAAALGSALWFGYPTDPTFEEAKRDPSKRAAYVEAVERKFKLNELPYVEDIRYSSSPRFDTERGQAAMETLDANIRSIGKGGKFVVQVYDGAFDSIFSRDDMEFVNCLVDHEVEGHAKPLSLGYVDLRLEDLELARKCKVKTYEGSAEQTLFVDGIVCELYAYRNQLRKASQRGMNNQFSRVFGDYLYWFSVLINPQVQDSLDREVTKRLLDEFFIPELAEYNVEMRSYKGPVILPDGKMVSYFGVVDLPDYLKEKVDRLRSEGR